MRLIQALFCTTASCGLLALASPAFSQDAVAETDVGEIVVTGSRIATNGNNSPTPLTVTSSEQLQKAAPRSLGESLNQLPVFKGSNTSAGSTSSANTPGGGGNILSLRGLGGPRTLVLINGQRTVPTTSGGTSDINNFPMSLVQRVEVVTGGASAAYGSDAVSGVVNFILDTNFKGLKAEVATGISGEQDFESYKVGLTFGTPFADGRGSFVGSLDYFVQNNPSADFSRDWEDAQDSFVQNPVAGAFPTRIRASDVRLSSAAFGGLISSGPLRGIRFGPGGVVQRQDFGILTGSQNQVGGDGDFQHRGYGAQIDPQISAYARVGYEVSEALKLSADVLYGNTKSSTTQYPTWHFLTTAPQIQIDNAFLPASVRAQMVAAGVTQFPLGRIDADGEQLSFNTTNEVKRFSVAANGDVGSWTYHGYYTHGKSSAVTHNINNINERNYYAAIDSVVNSAGQIVCRATLTGNSPGCVPFNPFGQGSPSDAANAYVRGDSLRDLTTTQNAASFDIQRDIFKLWSDPVTLAVGAEYRHEKALQLTDAISPSILSFPGIRGAPAGLVGKAGGFAIGNPLPAHGSFNVREAFAELNVPVLRGRRGAELLVLNAAGRLTDYSNSGQVETWKIGGTYKPVEDVTVRVTRSRDIRAANIGELFASGVGNAGGTVINPVTNTTAVLQGLLQAGNPNLTPEIADTFTAGLVVEPSFLPGFYASADYYKIKVNNAIALLAGDVAVKQCLLESNVTACSLFTSFSPTLINWTQQYLNIGSVETAGVDVEAGYRRQIAGGDLSLRYMVSFLERFVQTTPGAVPLDIAGQVGTTKWQWTAQASYRRDNWQVFLQQRYIGESVLLAQYIETRDISDNTIPPIGYTDLTVSYYGKVQDHDYEAFLTVNNLLDQGAPWVPFNSATITSHTNPAVYDVVGRYFTMGLRVRY